MIAVALALFASQLAPEPSSASAARSEQSERRSEGDFTSPITDRVGLFVGINEGGAGRSDLRHAVEDAERMRDVFAEVGEMPQGNATTLRSPTRRELLAALDAVAARAPKSFVFYYSGHADDRALLLGRDTLDFAELRAKLDAIPAKLSLHLVDACRSGAMTRRKGATVVEPVAVEARAESEGRVVITSSAEWEDSIESDRLGGSFFTVHLASGLRGSADADRDGKVTLDEAYTYVYARTVESTLAPGVATQHPAYHYDLRGRGDYVLTRPGVAGLAQLTVGPNADYVIAHEVSGRLVAELRARAAGERIAVAPGVYRVKKRDGGALYEGVVTLGPGEARGVDGELSAVLPPGALARRGGAGRVARIAVQGGLRGALGAQAPLAPELGAVVRVPVDRFDLALRLSAATTRWTTPRASPRLELDLDELAFGAHLELPIAIDDALEVWGGAGLSALALRQSVRDASEAPRSTVGGRAAIDVGVRYDLGAVALLLDASLSANLYSATEATLGPVSDGELVVRALPQVVLGLELPLGDE